MAIWESTPTGIIAFRDLRGSLDGAHVSLVLTRLNSPSRQTSTVVAQTLDREPLALLTVPAVTGSRSPHLGSRMLKLTSWALQRDLVY